MSRPRILITGATGFVARALVPELVKEADVILLLLEEFGSGTPLPAPLNRLRADVETVYADLRNYPITARAVRQARPDKVVHLAAVGVSDPFLNVNTALSHNVTGTLNLLRACFQVDGVDVSQLIVARTPGERTAMNAYAASKAAAWSFCSMYAHTAQWPIQGAMIFQAFGPHQPSHLLVPSALQAALAGEDFPMTSGEQQKDWIYIDDIVRGFQAHLKAELSPGTTVEIGTGRSTRVADVVEELYRIVNRGGRPNFRAIPNRPGEDPQQTANADQTATSINWRAQLSLSEALERLVKSTEQ